MLFCLARTRGGRCTALVGPPERSPPLQRLPRTSNRHHNHPSPPTLLHRPISASWNTDRCSLSKKTAATRLRSIAVLRSAASVRSSQLRLFPWPISPTPVWPTSSTALRPRAPPLATRALSTLRSAIRIHRRVVPSRWPSIRTVCYLGSRNDLRSSSKPAKRTKRTTKIC